MLQGHQRFVAEIILEVIMLMAPTYLDTLGAVGEFILKLNQSTVEFACESHGHAQTWFQDIEQMRAAPHLT